MTPANLVLKLTLTCLFLSGLCFFVAQSTKSSIFFVAAISLAFITLVGCIVAVWVA